MLDTATELREKVWDVITSTDWNKFKEKDTLILSIEVKAELVRSFKKIERMIDHLLVRVEND